MKTGWQQHEDDRRRTAVAVARGMIAQKKADVAALWKAIRIVETHTYDTARIRELVDEIMRHRPAA